VVRLLNRLGYLAATALMVVIPTVYALLSIRGARQALVVETVQVSQDLNRVVMNRPELWVYEVVRLQDVIDEPTHSGPPEDRTIRSLDGREVAHTAFRAPGPAISCAVPFYDSGRMVGLVEARRSIRPEAFQTLGVALFCALAGWGLYFIFRLMPLRALDRALSELSDERERIAATLHAIPDGVIAADGNDAVIFLNPAAETTLGQASAQVTGRPISEIYPVQRAEPPLAGTHPGLAELRLPGEPTRIIEERYSLLRGRWSDQPGRVIVFRDISDQLKTEAELLRVRQVESLGVLAGGIAHDFNNHLSAILGYITLAKEELPRGGQTSKWLAEAVKATDRARALSLRLLTFAKGGDPARRVVDLAPLVRKAAAFGTHGTRVEFTCQVEPGLWNADIDEGLISQVIHNLVSNAVQAMQDQGRIDIRLENLRVEGDEILHLRPGPYLRVRVQDSGPGIPASILPRIFEPYFTTKSAGSGLGLASSFNILKAHGGNITADSEPGQGATFLLYLPATDRPLDRRFLVPLPPPAFFGRGRLLIMEDDPVLKEIAAEMVERCGFTPQTCPDGESAIRAYTMSLQEEEPFRAVIMDLTIVGGMGGREAATHILALHPEATLIVSSGYSVDPVMARPGDFGFKAVLPKPYGLPDLARVLDEVVPAPR
jgi:PAS domain S-box-containing protein